MKGRGAVVIGAGVVFAPLVLFALVRGVWWGGLLGVLGYILVILALLAVERFRYKPVIATPPDPPWVETQERFIDPETGRKVVVYQQPETGERAYVADGDRAAS